MNLPVYVDNKQIEQVKETVFLGVILDENLNWIGEPVFHMWRTKFIGIIYSWT